jgi:DDE superfamily endonuclease
MTGGIFVKSMYPRMTMSCHDLDWIINMDQTTIYFAMHKDKLILHHGEKMVLFKIACNASMRVTITLSVTASGKQLEPYFVFKGQPGGTVESEVSHFPIDGKYAMQQNAWFDERIMMDWIDRVLELYIKQHPDGCVPLLLLDSYHCHTMDSILMCLHEIGVKVAHIPPGCTWIGQPVDVRCGKLLK